MAKPYNYKEKVTDDQLINLIESGVQNSVGDWLNSSDLTRERLRATYEYAGVPDFHLAPNGVSTIVATDTTETVEAYLAIISELMFNNNRLARFKPWEPSPAAIKAANQASEMVNYCIFKKNHGWEILNTWVKSALLWKNSIIRWDYIDDNSIVFEEYEEITEQILDEKLADPQLEIVGSLDLDPTTNTYKDVRLKRTVNKSRVRLENIPPENFRISRDAKSIEEAAFIGIQTDMTRSEIRKWWPEVAENIEEWDELGHSENWLGNARYSEDIAARKYVTGQEYWQGSVSQDLFPLEANREVTVTECWINVDRDGDGIAELKHFIIAGTHILYEEDVDMIPLASLSPFEVPYEFYGLSVADMTRSTTLTSTAILRGFVENTYLTNYAPKLADPNIVDFSALQNMKPKQIIPTNGNPSAAVQELPPSSISNGTVPLLEYLQQHKEQATGMSKAAQGLQDELYVSGNSEVKLGQVMSATQKRIQHIARRFVEGGFKRLIDGIYMTMKNNMDEINVVSDKGYGVFKINPKELPDTMDLEVDVDLGENSNTNMRDKLMLVGTQLIPLLKEGGQDMILKPEAVANVAYGILHSLDLQPEDYLRDHTTEEFLQEAQQAQQKAQEEQKKAQAIADRVEEAKAKQSEANAVYTKVQADNAIQDNVRQTAIALDKHQQEWSKLRIDAVGKEVEPADFNQVVTQPDINIIMSNAKSIVDGIEAAPKDESSLDEMVKQMGIDPQQIMQLLQQKLGGNV